MALSSYLDYVANFAKCLVSGGYAAGATTITLQSGEGSKLPGSEPYNLVWFNSTDYSDPSDDPNVEIVRVTARTGDQLTVTRGQEGTSDVAHDASGKTYSMILTLTKKLIDNLESKLIGLSKSGAHVKLSADQSVSASTDTIVQFDTEEYDLSNEYDTSAYKFTAAVAGYYLVTSMIYYEPAAGASGIVIIKKNGTTVAVINDSSFPSGGRSLLVSDVLSLAVNDYIQIEVLFSQAGDIKYSGGRSYLAVHRLYDGA